MAQQQEVSTTQIALKYGVFIGIASVVLTLFLWFFKLEEVWGVGFLSTIVWIVGFVLGMEAFKKSNNGFMKFGQGFNIGFMGGAVATLISAFYTNFHIRFLDMTFLPKLREELMKSTEKMNEEQLEAFRPWLEFCATPNFIFLMSMIMGLFASLIFGLVLSAILQKEDLSNPFGNK